MQLRQETHCFQRIQNMDGHGFLINQTTLATFPKYVGTFCQRQKIAALEAFAKDLQLLKEALPDLAEVPIIKSFMQKLKLQAGFGATSVTCHGKVSTEDGLKWHLDVLFWVQPCSALLYLNASVSSGSDYGQKRTDAQFCLPLHERDDGK